MRLLVYTGSDTETARAFVNAVNRAASGHEVQVLTAFAELIRALHRPKADLDAVVLLVSDRDELTSLHAVKELLRDVRTILVLPDSGQETMAMGFALYPRFVTHPERGLQDVEAVLQKMLAHPSGRCGDAVQLEAPLTSADVGEALPNVMTQE